MNRLSVLFAPLLVVMLLLAVACGGNDDDGDSSSDATPASQATTAGEDNETGDGNDDDLDVDDEAFGGNRGPNERVANLDICETLTDEEASDVAAEFVLAGAGATFTIGREDGEYTEEQQSIRTRASCRFVFDANTGNAGVIEVVVTEADDYDSLFKPGGEPIDDLGDDAVNNAGTVYVKVGDLMMSAGENTFTTDFTTEIFRKIAPDLE